MIWADLTRTFLEAVLTDTAALGFEEGFLRKAVIKTGVSDNYFVTKVNKKINLIIFFLSFC